MVVHLLTSIELSAFILIYITHGCTIVNIYTYVDGCTPSLNTSFFFMTCYITCASTNFNLSTLFFMNSKTSKIETVANNNVATLTLFTTKARGLQSCGPKRKPKSHLTCSWECKKCQGMNLHTPKQTAIVRVRLPNGLPNL